MLPEEMDEATEQAAYVVCHAGSGMIARALHAGRTPLVMPRRRRFGEHVDDHQVQLADRLAEFGLVIPVDDEIDSGRVARADLPRRSAQVMSHLPRMGDVLAQEIDLVAEAQPEPVERSAVIPRMHPRR